MSDGCGESGGGGGGDGGGWGDSGGGFGHNYDGGNNDHMVRFSFVSECSYYPVSLY